MLLYRLWLVHVPDTSILLQAEEETTATIKKGWRPSLPQHPIKIELLMFSHMNFV